MIGISKLYCGAVVPADALRYGRRAGALPGPGLPSSAGRRPVVVWNVTRACNLRCVHCYACAAATPAPDELSTAEGKALIDDLAGFGVPVILFSGGEPLARPDIFELLERAVARGRRAVLSTNGTLLDAAAARRLARIGLSYVGISLDGLGEGNDRFRGVPGAFSRAMAGIAACQRAGLKVGLRHTLTAPTREDLPAMFDLLETHAIPRICFYHLAYSGRGGEIAGADLDHAQTRQAVDTIIDRTAALFAKGRTPEVLTVDNHADGPYLYLRLLREGNPRAGEVFELLRTNGGSSSGHGIGCVGWDGTVFPDQFWRTQPLGHIRERPFSSIWTDAGNELLRQLRAKPAHVTGRCVACRFLALCGGNLRARAEAATGERWGVDPACYLTDEEIAPWSGEAPP
jgi:radical SAM protein with 4Fe4S-binding SPASM domain